MGQDPAWFHQELSGTSNLRYALSGAVYIKLVHYSHGKKADREVAYSFVQRTLRAEGQTIREVERREAIERGKELIEIKKTIPKGEWIDWVTSKSGYSYGTVQRYMRLAKD